MMSPLNEAYEHIIYPHNFIKNFADMYSFQQWARTGTINDLKATLAVYEDEQLFEHCEILEMVILEKVDDTLGLLGFNIF